LQIRIQALVRQQDEDDKQRTCVSDAVLVAPELEDLVAGGQVISKAQFNALAADDDIKSMLRSQAMQKVVRDIDDASHRERALAGALDNPQFSALCESVLDHISCNR
jgi:hypothetical protein